MGVKVEFVPTKWAGIIPALLTGKFDVIIGGMGSITKKNAPTFLDAPVVMAGYSRLVVDLNRSLEDASAFPEHHI